jgi:hypothetical protein
MPEHDNPPEGLPPAPLREPPLFSARSSFRLPRLLRRRHTLCCGHNIEQACENLEVSANAHRKRQLVECNRKFVGQLQDLLDELATGQSLNNNASVKEARKTLGSMRLFNSGFRGGARLDEAIESAISVLPTLGDAKWDDPEMRPSAIAYLEALRCQFSSQAF